MRLLRGDSFLQQRWENAPVSIAERAGTAAAATRTLIDKPTGTQREQLKIARTELDAEAAKIRSMAEKDVKELESLLDKLGAPWTPGRLPRDR
jgi:vacuolar-type H+-ATPase subunit H